jgi:hypothetical protein
MTGPSRNTAYFSVNAMSWMVDGPVSGTSMRLVIVPSVPSTW